MNNPRLFFYPNASVDACDTSLPLCRSCGPKIQKHEVQMPRLGIRDVSANFWFNIAMVVLLQLVFRLLAYAVLRRSK